MPHGQNSGAIALVGSGEYSLPMLELETQLLHRMKVIQVVKSGNA